MPDDLSIRSLLPREEVAICTRLREGREKSRKRQAEFARELGISRVRLASYEYAKAPVRYDIGKEVCYRLNINQRWLATGRLPMQPYFDVSPNLEFAIKPKSLFSMAYTSVLESEMEERFQDLEAMLGKDIVEAGTIEGAVLDNFHLVGSSPPKAVAFYARRVVGLYLSWLPEGIVLDYAEALLETHRSFVAKHAAIIEQLIKARLAKKRTESADSKTITEKGLTGNSLKGNSDDVKTELARLIARVQRAAGKPGVKAELARFLDVAPARITEWLTDDVEKRKEPGGHYTLQLLKWVERQECKPK